MALRGSFKGVEKSLKKLDPITSGDLQAKVAKAVGAEFLDLVNEGFTSGQDPYGEKWADLKYRDGQPLRDNGHLGSGFNLNVDGTKVTIDNPVPYGIHHQYGAPKAHIPARPMLPRKGELPEVWQEAAEEAALEVVLSALKR